MLFNYIKLAIRLLVRNPFFTLINVLGLAIGFVVFFILWQYSKHELKSDQQWRDANRIARIGILWEWSDDDKYWESEKYGTTLPPFAILLTNDYPELESFTRILHRTQFTRELTGLDKDIMLSYENPAYGEVKMLEDKIVMADGNFFEFFSIPLIKGEASLVLKDINTAVIANSIAKKYFGLEESLGKMISVNKEPFIVTGVFDDLPHNTHLDFQVVLSNRGKLSYWDETFMYPCITSYVKSKQHPDWKEFQRKLNQPEMIDKYYGPAIRAFKSKASTLVQPLSEVSFSQKWRGDQFNPKSENLLRIFRWVGLLVLVMAFVNYISLANSRIKNRQTEVATRKVSGASHSDFVKQFIIESTLIFIVALAFAFTLLQLVKYPLFVSLQIPVFETDKSSLLFFSSVVAVMILLSAMYPTYVARVPKIRDLFNKAIQRRGNLGFQWSLTSLQFSIAVILIIWGFMIYKQVTFVLSKDLGFGKANLITIDAPILKTAQYESDLEVFKNKLRSISGIQNVTSSSTVVGDNVWGFRASRSGKENSVGLDTNGGVDEYFIPLYNITILAGRNFNHSDRDNSIIISEGALPRLGFNTAEDAVGSIIEVEGKPAATKTEGWIAVTIVGVIKSYRLRPMLIFSGDHDIKADAGIALTYKHYLNTNLQPERFTIKVDAAKAEPTLHAVEQVYAELFPGNVFNWYALDDHINRHYQSEKTWRNQILFFTCLAISIACLGMFGMISNKVSEKTKEIGIRKVLGAGLYQIGELLLTTTAKQIAIATVVGIPIAFYLTQEYLEKFSERIELQWWHYVLPVALLIIIMSTTVASVLLKAARTNPVESLRSE